MKKFIFPIILVVLIVLELIYMDKIKEFTSNFINNRPELVIAPTNEYTKNYDFLYVKQDKEYVPYSINDIKNIYYSTINNGWNEFTFYCPDEYELCLKDVQSIRSNNMMLTTFNNFVNPYNSVSIIETSYDDSGEVNLKLDKLYTDDEIKAINAEVDKIISENIMPEMSDENKIKTIHDYIINNTEYDIERNEHGSSKYKSNTAYGALIEHQAICSGYTDLMAIFLDKLGFKNFKVSSENHIWNAVYINDKWLHLDLTWDDPVSARGPILDHKYFLVDNNELVKQDGEELEIHKFDKKVYLEFNY